MSNEVQLAQGINKINLLIELKLRIMGVKMHIINAMIDIMFLRYSIDKEKR